MKMSELDEAIDWAERFIKYAKEIKEECEHSPEYYHYGVWPQRGDMKRMAIMLWRSLPKLQK